MTYSVIDIGSNSVRLTVVRDGKTLYKKLDFTRLGEKKDANGNLFPAAKDKTVTAVKNFVNIAKKENSDGIFAFATAAVRTAKDGRLFAAEIEKQCGVKVDIVSGEKEAELGVLGALCGKDGGVIDVGGASTEIAVVKGGKVIYSKSVGIGAVNLTEKFGESFGAVSSFVANGIKEYGEVPPADFRIIGGTAVTLAVVDSGLKEYDPLKTDGRVIFADRLSEITRTLSLQTPEERETVSGVDKRRADVIVSGAIIFCELIKYLGVKSFTVSESDNAEGYLRYVTGNL